MVQVADTGFSLNDSFLCFGPIGFENLTTQFYSPFNVLEGRATPAIVILCKRRQLRVNIVLAIVEKRAHNCITL